YPATGKLAFRNEYTLRLSDLQSDIFQMHSDVAQYFNLPAPSASTWQLSDVHQKMLFENVFSNQPLQQADEFAAITTA
ncbi:hypothetical protein OFN32_41525, partial [Escherichia coli]|nr:hypothetical protein [Escherichia coli]